MENEARKVFSARKEYNWALAIKEEEDAKQEWAKQRGLSSKVETLDEIIIEKRASIEAVEEVEEVLKKVQRRKRRREEDILLEGVKDVNGPRARKRPSRYLYN